MNVNKMWRQKCRRLEAKCKSLQEAEDNTGNDKLLQIERTRGGKRLTLEGTVSLAIRRNFGNCATADVGAMLLEDISRFTVARAEVKAGTALLASSRIFFPQLVSGCCQPKPWRVQVDNPQLHSRCHELRYFERIETGSFDPSQCILA